MSSQLEPNSRVKRVQAYRVPRALAPVDLKLDANEGQAPSAELLNRAFRRFSAVNRYPSTSELETVIANRLGVDPEQVVVTAGADEAINRVCLASLEPGQEVILPVPTFEMIAHYAKLAGATIKEVNWAEGDFPTEAVLGALSSQTGLISIVSPNNPTGLTISEKDLERIASTSTAMVLLDEAYSEFAESSLLDTALKYENVITTRTLSKAWGLAGLRIGFAVANKTAAGWMRAVGSPYPVSAFSIACALEALEGGDETKSYVAEARIERQKLTQFLESCGCETSQSNGNFVFASVKDSVWLRDAMAGMGIGIRAFPGNELLKNKVRISLPGCKNSYSRLESALACIIKPEAILFDLDGVIADVSSSYREAIIQTAAAFGETITREDIAEAKAQGNANNDWVVTTRLLETKGKTVSLKDVTAKFEEIYQGTEQNPGLRSTESMIISRSFLEKLKENYRLAIITGRPRKDAECFLGENGILDIFETLVCMEDAELKPDPAPVNLAMSRLGTKSAWMIGDTPDDVQAARGSTNVLPIGVCAPGDSLERMTPALVNKGAARVFSNAEEIEEFLQ